MQSMEVEHYSAPRIHKDHFRAHKGNLVIVVGKIAAVNMASRSLSLEVNPGKATIVEALLNPEYIRVEEFRGLEGYYVEVTGTVKEEGSLDVREFCSYGESFDLETYNELVTLANNQFRSLFRAGD